MAFQTKILETKFFPSGSRGDQPAILLGVHGRGGKRELMEWVPKRFSISGLDFLSLQAPFAEDVPEMKSPGFSWYLRQESGELQGLEESRSKIGQLIEELVSYGYARNRIYWIGFSQGGVMGLDLSLRHSKALGGVMNISGFCLQLESYPEAFGAGLPMQKIICTHGERDPIVDYQKAKAGYEKLQSLGAPLLFKEFSKPHSFDLKNEIPFLIESLQKWTTA
jgi:phospholipase/carboxylesterase